MRKGFAANKDSHRNKLWLQHNLNKVNPQTQNLTLDQCIEEKHEECLYPQSEFLSYFCGNTHNCRPSFLHDKKVANLTYSESTGKTETVYYTKTHKQQMTDLNYALNRAKLNVKNNYFIVGHEERLSEFLQFLHNALPSYFRGSQFFYNKLISDETYYQEHVKAETEGKVQPSQKTLDYLHEKLKYEILLYDFIKEEFNRKIESFRSNFKPKEIRIRV